MNHAHNKPVTIPQYTSHISHNAPFCNRNVHICAHFCYKMVYCGNLWDGCIMHCGISEKGLLMHWTDTWDWCRRHICTKCYHSTIELLILCLANKSHRQPLLNIHATSTDIQSHDWSTMIHPVISNGNIDKPNAAFRLKLKNVEWRRHVPVSARWQVVSYEWITYCFMGWSVDSSQGPLNSTKFFIYWYPNSKDGLVKPLMKLDHYKYLHLKEKIWVSSHI